MNGTPILDVKPYIPSADSIPVELVTVPSWIVADAPVAPNKAVTIAPEAEVALRRGVQKLEFYKSYEEVWAAITEVGSVTARL